MRFDELTYHIHIDKHIIRTPIPKGRVGALDISQIKS